MNVTTQSFGHKVLSVLMALVLVIGLAPMVPAGNAYAADEVDVPANALAVWQGHGFNYNVEQNKDKEYVVTSGDQFAVESVVDPATQKALDEDEYTVVYFQDADKDRTLDGEDPIVESGKTISGKVGTMPKDAGDYLIVVMKTDSIPSNYVPRDGQTWNTWLANMPAGQTLLYKGQAFKVKAAPVSVEGAYAFDYVKGADEELLDTTFMFTGKTEYVAFAVDGEQLMTGQYTLTWTAWPGKEANEPQPTWNGDKSAWSYTDAGTYTAEISGYAPGFTGDATVTFVVDPIDLTNDTIVAKDYYKTGTNAKITDMTGFTVNGEEVNGLGDIIEVDPYMYVNAAGEKVRDFSDMNDSGAYTYRLSILAAGDNVIGGPRDVTVYTTDYAVEFTYDGKLFDDNKALDGRVFNQAEGEAFDPELVKAAYTDADGSNAVDYKLTVTKDGEPVSSYAEPGKYELTVESLDTEGYVYGGIDHATFYVVRDVLVSPVAYMTIDGKYVTGANDSFTYTQSAMTAVVTVKDGDKVLTAGKDFTVSYTKDGEPVDEILNAGEYQAVISLDGYIVETPGADELTIDFTVTKAPINYVEAVQESYGAIALPADGSAAAVSFVGYTTGKASGIAYTLAPEDIWTVYLNKDGQKVDADELTAAGKYTANVTILDTCANLEGGDDGVAFTLANTVAFNDVTVNDWFCGYVWDAASLGYMNGVQGTSMFLPLADINRAEVAMVVYNMAGKPDKVESTTDFDDMTSSFGWAAQAVSFAATAGIVTGYGPDFTNFGPADAASREAIATMMYRYAEAAGMDASVEDVDAALAKYSDGDEVSEWAREAMAWCVENGVMGVGTDALNPQDNVIRAEVAAIATRVQPEKASKPDVDNPYPNA